MSLARPFSEVLEIACRRSDKIVKVDPRQEGPVMIASKAPKAGGQLRMLVPEKPLVPA